jgi:hypothetical protein
MKPFNTLMTGYPVERSAPEWFGANAAGSCTVLVFDGPRAPKRWVFFFGMWRAVHYRPAGTSGKVAA